jgi:hypothetical protein
MNLQGSPPHSTDTDECRGWPCMFVCQVRPESAANYVLEAYVDAILPRIELGDGWWWADGHEP